MTTNDLTPNEIDHVVTRLTHQHRSVTAPFPTPSSGHGLLASAFVVKGQELQTVPCGVPSRYYRGLLGYEAAEDTRAIVALLYGRPTTITTTLTQPTTIGLWGLAVTRSGAVYVSGPDMPSQRLDLARLPIPCAALAAIMTRAFGHPVPMPKDDPVAPALASNWARAICRRARRDGKPLDVTEAHALDPANDQGNPFISWEGNLVGLYEELVRRGLRFWPDITEIEGEQGHLGAFANWLDVGSAGWVLLDDSLPITHLAIGLRRSLEEDGHRMVIETIDERGWLPPSRTVSDERALELARYLGTNPLDVAPLHAQFPPDPLDDPVLLGALVTATFFSVLTPLRTLQGSRWFPDLTIDFCTARAYATEAERDIGYKRRPVTTTHTTAPVPAHQIGILNERTLTDREPLAGLGMWRLPAGTDGVAFCVLDHKTADDRHHQPLSTIDSRHALGDDGRNPYVYSHNQMLVVAVNRSGEAAYGRFEKPVPPEPDDDYDPDYPWLFTDPPPPPPQRLEVYRVDENGVPDEPMVGLAAALGRRLMGLPVTPLLFADEVMGAYLAGVWARELLRATRPHHPGEVDMEMATKCDPYRKNPDWFGPGASWSRLREAVELGHLDIECSPHSTVGSLRGLGNLLDDGLLSHILAAATPTHYRITQDVSLACPPLTANRVLDTMAERGWLPIRWPKI